MSQESFREIECYKNQSKCIFGIDKSNRNSTAVRKVSVNVRLTTLRYASGQMRIKM